MRSALVAAALAVTATAAVALAQPADRAAAGKAGFLDVTRVLQSPRCMNCHPAGDAPLQGDDARRHAQNVVRGDDGRGVFGMKCRTCHQEQNVGGEPLPPGAPDWRLPAASMPLVFEGKTPRELCLQIKDPQKNGGKTLDQVVEHVARDGFVTWAFAPGEGRVPPPGTRDDLVAATRSWVSRGAACPDR